MSDAGANILEPAGLTKCAAEEDGVSRFVYSSALLVDHLLAEGKHIRREVAL